MKPLALLFLLTLAGLAQDRPQLLSSVPAQGQENVNPYTEIRLVFSKPMDTSTGIQDCTRYDVATGAMERAYGYWNSDGTSLGLSFYTTPMRASAAYRLDVDAGKLKDRAGNSLAPVAPIYFTTFLHADRSGPKLAGSVPADGETGVATNTGIYLVFDRPIANFPYAEGISVSTASGPLKFTATVAADRVIQIKTPLLLPPRERLTVKVAGIVDRTGATLAAPVTVSFQTGAMPDTQEQQMLLKPPSETPSMLPLRVRFAKPIDPLLLSLGSATFQGSYEMRYTGTPALSSDRRTVTIDGRVPPGVYNVSFTIPFDRATGQMGAFWFKAVIGTAAGDSPIQLTAVSPPDGATDVPITATIGFAFSRPVDAVSASQGITLSANGRPVAGEVIANAAAGLVNFKPAAGLETSTAYTLSMEGVRDVQGNLFPAYTGSFTTGLSGAYADKLALLSLDPPNRATGVDPSTSIVATFNHPLSPLSAPGVCNNFVSDSNGAVACDCSVNGVVLTLRPRAPLASGGVSVSVSRVNDLAGAWGPGVGLTFSVSGGQPDTVPPEVISVSPGDGATVLYAAARIELAFSEPVNPATIFAPFVGAEPVNFAAYREGMVRVPLKVTSISETRVALEFNAPPGALVTLMANSGLTDLAGNALVPFRTTVRTSLKPAGGGAHIIRQVPFSQYGFAAVDDVLTLYWSAPLDRASVEQNFKVYSADGLISGRFEWTADSRGFSFTPTTPWREGAKVGVFLAPPAHDAAGLPIEFEGSFSVGYRAKDSGELMVTGSSFPSRVPLNFVLDLQFNQDLPDSFLQTVKATLAQPGQTPVNAPFARIRARVLRFKSPFPLLPNTYYTFVFEAGPKLRWSAGFTTANTLASAKPMVAMVGPDGTGAPQNSIISILFSEGVNKLAMPGGARLLLNGVAIPIQYTWNGDQGLRLQPATFLKPETTYQVVVTGFENLAGIALPDFSTTFRTGSGIDTAPLTVLRVRPSGAEIGPDAVVSFHFDKPIAPDAIAGSIEISCQRSSDSERVPSTQALTDGMRTLIARPDAPLPAGASVSASLIGMDDLAGNSLDRRAGTTFQVGFGGAPPVTITLVSPRPESSGVPLNATVQLQSSGNLTLGGEITASLRENGNPLEASWSIGADGRTLTIVPRRPFSPASRIDVTVIGIAADPYTYGFNTGLDPDTLAPVLTMWPAAEQERVPASVVIRIRSNEPLGPLSVNTGTVTLRAGNEAWIDASVSLDESGRLISLTPRLPLVEPRRYVAHCTVTDLAGNRADIGHWFTVGPPDGPRTVLRGMDPPDGAVDVSARPMIQAVFNNPVDLTLGEESFRLLLDGVPVPGTVTFSGTTVTFSPSRMLRAGGTYRIELRGVVDALGTAIPEAASTFTVANADADYTPVRLLSSIPAVGAVGVPADAPIRLSFNRPVTFASASSLIVSAVSSRNTIPIDIRVEGNGVVLQPVAPLPGGNSVSVSGRVTDLAGGSINVYVPFTVAATMDTTPPVVESVFPAPGSSVPVYGTRFTLRFSEPVTVPAGSIRVVGINQASPLSWRQAQDGRTISTELGLTPESDITLGIASGLTDLAGNSIVPVSFQWRSLSTEESQGPKVKSFTPPAGAINVPVDTSIRLAFTHEMDPVSLETAIHVTADGIPVTGALNISPERRELEFKPDAAFRKGAVVSVFAGPATDAAGQRLDAVTSFFTIVKDAAASTPSVVAISASATAIDLRFDAPLDRYEPDPYLRSGHQRVASHWEFRGEGSLRVIPDEPLQPDRAYSLVLDDHTEYPLRLAAGATGVALREVLYEDGAIRIRFEGEINPLTVDPRTVRLIAADGSSTPYFAEWAFDSGELILRPAAPSSAFTVVVDGLESASGSPVPSGRVRVSKRR